jgi:hypothetical protein
MQKLTFESRQRLLKMWSVRIQSLWAAGCGAYIAMPDTQQQSLLGLVGLTGDGALSAASFFAQASLAVAAATIAARATHQNSLPGA